MLFSFRFSLGTRARPSRHFSRKWRTECSKGKLEAMKTKRELFRATHFVVVLHIVILFKLTFACFFRSYFLHCFITRQTRNIALL